jgi:hypothetical protein
VADAAAAAALASVAASASETCICIYICVPNYHRDADAHEREEHVGEVWLVGASVGHHGTGAKGVRE